MPKFWPLLWFFVLIVGCVSTTSIDDRTVKISHSASPVASEKLNLTASPGAFEVGVEVNLPAGTRRMMDTSFAPSSITFLKHALCFIDCSRLVGKRAVVEGFEATVRSTTIERQPFNTGSPLRSVQAGDAIANAILKLAPDKQLFLASAKIVIRIDSKDYSGVAEATADNVSRAVELATNSAAFSLLKAIE